MKLIAKLNGASDRFLNRVVAKGSAEASGAGTMTCQCVPTFDCPSTRRRMCGTQDAGCC